MHIPLNEYATTAAGVPTCIDLFSGAGGLSLGFAQAGGLPLAAVDSDADSIETYRQMFPICPGAWCGDIREWQPPQDGSVDVVIGGPPCQGFSLARGTRFLDDPRNHLYKEFVRIVEAVAPRWIVMENVPGITNIGGGAILEQIYEDFGEIGYRLTHKVVNMAEYGVPQIRKRAIFVGHRDGAEFRWPEPICRIPPRSELGGTQASLMDERSAWTTVRDALGDLPWPLGGYFAHRANSQMRGPRNRKVQSEPAFTLRVRGDEFALCEEPATSAFVPGPVPKVELAYRPADHGFQALMRAPAPVWAAEAEPQWPEIDTPVPALTGTRRISVREQARLQTFPDWFTFHGRVYSQSRQVGNAVPPLFARQLFGALLEQSAQAEDVAGLLAHG